MNQQTIKLVNETKVIERDIMIQGSFFSLVNQKYIIRLKSSYNSKSITVLLLNVTMFQHTATDNKIIKHNMKFNQIQL